MKKLITVFCALALFTVPAFANLTFGPLTSNGSTASQVLWPTRQALTTPVEIRMTGTFASATLKIETREKGGSVWISHPDSAMTAAGVVVLYLIPGDDVRVTVTGATGSTSVTVRVR